MMGRRRQFCPPTMWYDRLYATPICLPLVREAQRDNPIACGEKHACRDMSVGKIRESSRDTRMGAKEMATGRGALWSPPGCGHEAVSAMHEGGW